MNENTNVSSSSSFKSGQASGTSEPRDDAALALGASVAAGAHDLGDQAKHVAGDVMAQAKKSAESRISGGKDRAAESLGEVADALRHTGERLREQDGSGLTDYVVRAADRVEAASDYLQRRSLSDVIGDLGAFARREPALFLGGAFTIGLLGGRFLKSSHSRTLDVGTNGEPRQKPEAAGSNQTANREQQRASRDSSRGSARDRSGSSTQRKPGVGQKGIENAPSSGQDSQGNGGSGPKASGGI